MAGVRVSEDNIRQVFDVNNTKFITEVKKRPSLYNKELKEYGDISLKRRMWAEVCQQVMGDWDTLTKEAKNNRVNHAKKRWENLRGSFRRELRIRVQKKKISKRHRPYRHFNKLQFLRPFVRQELLDGNIEISVSNESDEEEEPYGDIIDSPTIHKYKITETSVEPSVPELQWKQQIDNESQVHDALLKALNGSLAEQDQETHFALSLVPHLRKLPEEKQLKAKLGIFHLIQSITNTDANEEITLKL